MKPRDTTFRLSRSGGEWNRLYALDRRESGKAHRMMWPVVVAERDGKIIGFLGTNKRDDAVIAGPLVIDSKRVPTPNPFLCIRLVEAYEAILQAARVKFYFFDVARSNFRWLAHVQAVGVPVVAEDEKHVLFKREI